jgi:serine/threonine protein kinase
MSKERLFGARWKVVGNLREGGQGWVYRVIDTTGEFGGEYALKRLKNKDRIGRFRTEIEVLRRLNDPRIIKLIDAGAREDEKEPYLVMPIAKNGDLSDRLSLYAGQIESVVQVALQIAQALDHAHKAGVIHRDIKPGNILFPELSHDVLVADFGISFDLQAAERNTADGEVVGPRTFIAPELTEFGNTEVTPAADVYSLGQLAFYMLTGGRWVSQTSVLDARYDDVFSKGERYRLLRVLLSKMIAPLSRRYSTMGLVIRDLEQITVWEQRQTGRLLDADALKATATLQRRTTERRQSKARFDEIRNTEIELIDSVVAGVTNMLFETLGREAELLNAGGELEATAELNQPGGRQQIKIDTGNDSLFEERNVVSLTIRIPEERRRFASLRLLICNEVFHTRPVTHDNYLGPAGNPSLAVVPMYSEPSSSLPNAANEIGYVFGRARKFGARGPVPITSAPPRYGRLFGYSYTEGNMAVVRFNAADWPAATDDILDMVSEVFSRMMRHIAQEQR